MPSTERTADSLDLRADRAHHRYRAFGLRIASELALPELGPGDASGGAPDLVVRFGEAPDRLEDPSEERVLWSVRPDAWLHEVPGVGRFYVRDGGREVVLDRRGGTDADLRAFLLGTTLGAVLHQRGRFVLHASTAVLPGGAVAIAGASGAGKSTTLAELVRRGYPALADDKTVVRFGPDGRPLAVPGAPSLRLWHDAVDRLGADPAGLPALREGLPKVVAPAAAFRDEPTPLRALVVLVAGNEATAPERLGPAEALGTVLRQTYRRRTVDGSGRRAEHFRWAARLAGAVPVVRIGRASHEESVQALADAVEAVAAG